MQSSHGWRVPSVGITDGDASGALSSIGIDFSRWNENGGLSSPNGAVFFMNPDDGPAVHGLGAVLALIAVNPLNTWQSQ